jgi:two-component sensor histidine kinase
MLALLEATNAFPRLLRLATTGFAIATAYFFQIPIETEVPGEPFLLFFAIIVGATLLFGRTIGLLAVVLSSLLSLHFFDPGGSIYIYGAADLIKVEIYALFSAGLVLVVARLSQALLATSRTNHSLAALEKQKSVLLSEVVHRVANNFAIVAALLRQKSILISDPQAKSALQEAIEQVSVMTRIHGRLCVNDNAVGFNTQIFMQELCEDIRSSVVSLRPISIECTAISYYLPVADAVPLGLIVNELITNAIKYAFPDGRAGIIRLSLDRSGAQLCLSVQDDGVGMKGSAQGTGVGHKLVHALAQQLGACVEIESGREGTTICVRFNAAPELDFSTIMHSGTGTSALTTGFAQSSA